MNQYLKTTFSLVGVVFFIASAQATAQGANVVGLCAEVEVRCIENDIVAIIDPQEGDEAMLLAAINTSSRHKQYFGGAVSPVAIVRSEYDFPHAVSEALRSSKSFSGRILYWPKEDAKTPEALRSALGSGWFRESLMDNVERKTGDRYSNVSYPSWLYAAINSIYREAPLDEGAWQRATNVQHSRLMPLERFFAMDAAQYRSSPNKQDLSLRRTVQSNLFVEFMIKITEDRKVFHHIAHDVFDNSSMENWLASQHRYTVLPKAVIGLEVLFQQWVRAKR